MKLRRGAGSVIRIPSPLRRQDQRFGFRGRVMAEQQHIYPRCGPGVLSTRLRARRGPGQDQPLALVADLGDLRKLPRVPLPLVRRLRCPGVGGKGDREGDRRTGTRCGPDGRSGW